MADVNTDLSTMSDEDLEAYALELQAEADAMKETRRAVAAERDTRVAASQVENLLSGLSPQAVQALVARVGGDETQVQALLDQAAASNQVPDPSQPAAQGVSLQGVETELVPMNGDNPVPMAPPPHTDLPEVPSDQAKPSPVVDPANAGGNIGADLPDVDSSKG